MKYVIIGCAIFSLCSSYSGGVLSTLQKNFFHTQGNAEHDREFQIQELYKVHHQLYRLEKGRVAIALNCGIGSSEYRKIIEKCNRMHERAQDLQMILEQLE